MEVGRKMFFTSAALVKLRNFPKYLQNPTSRLLLSWLLFSLNVYIFSHNGGQEFWHFGLNLLHVEYHPAWGDFQSSSLCQLCCFPKSAAKWEVQSLTEDVLYLESTLDKDVSCTALLQTCGGRQTWCSVRAGELESYQRKVRWKWKGNEVSGW